MYGSLGPDGVPSPDDLDFARAHWFGNQSPWLKLIAWRWPLSLLTAAWVLAIGLATRAAPRTARWREAPVILVVAVPSVLLASTLVRSGLAWWTGELALAPVAAFPDLALPTPSATITAATARPRGDRRS